MRHHKSVEKAQTQTQTQKPNRQITGSSGGNIPTYLADISRPGLTETETETETEEEVNETDWNPNAKHYEIGTNEGYTADEVNWLADGFGDFYPTRKPAYKDLDAGFRTWLRSEISRRNVAGRRKSLDGKQGAKGFAECASEVAAGLRRHEESLPGGVSYDRGPWVGAVGIAGNDEAG